MPAMHKPPENNNDEIYPEGVTQQVIANLTEGTPIRRWYLPLAGREHITYDSNSEARIEADKLCSRLGLPPVDPISVK